MGKMERLFSKKWEEERRPFFVDAQRNSYGAFIDDIEIHEAYPENEDMAIKVIEMLKRKYNLIF